MKNSHTHTYTYIYIHIHTYAYIYIHIHTYTYIYIHIHTYTYIYIHVHTHKYIYIYIHVYIYMQYIYVRHTHTHIYIYKHIYIYTYTHIHIFVSLLVTRPWMLNFVPVERLEAPGCRLFFPLANGAPTGMAGEPLCPHGRPTGAWAVRHGQPEDVLSPDERAAEGQQMSDCGTTPDAWLSQDPVGHVYLRWRDGDLTWSPSGSSSTWKQCRAQVCSAGLHLAVPQGWSPSLGWRLGTSTRSFGCTIMGKEGPMEWTAGLGSPHEPLGDSFLCAQDLHWAGGDGADPRGEATRHEHDHRLLLGPGDGSSPWHWPDPFGPEGAVVGLAIHDHSAWPVLDLLWWSNRQGEAPGKESVRRRLRNWGHIDRRLRRSSLFCPAWDSAFPRPSRRCACSTSQLHSKSDVCLLQLLVCVFDIFNSIREHTHTYIYIYIYSHKYIHIYIYIWCTHENPLRHCCDFQ